MGCGTSNQVVIEPNSFDIKGEIKESKSEPLNEVDEFPYAN